MTVTQTAQGYVQYKGFARLGLQRCESCLSDKDLELPQSATTRLIGRLPSEIRVLLI